MHNKFKNLHSLRSFGRAETRARFKGVMYKALVSVIKFSFTVLTLLMVAGCISIKPSLKKYGWSAVDSNEIPKHIITDELCHAPSNQLYNSIWYTNKKKDYLICDKYSFYEDFCFGAWLCYNMDEYYTCSLSVPVNKGGWNENRPEKLSIEQRSKNNKAEIFWGVSCEDEK